MIGLSEKIRGYVSDPSVGANYGAWGALRPDQRKQIRELCDLCDLYEHAAIGKHEEIVRLEKMLAKKCDMCVERERAKIATEIFEDIKKLYHHSIDGCAVFDMADFAELKKKYTEG